MNQRDGFDRRLDAARSKAGAGKRADTAGLPAGAMGIGLRAGVEVVAALVVGVGLGLLLDRWLGTWPWLFLLFFLLGGAAGVLNVMRLFKPTAGVKPGLGSEK